MRMNKIVASLWMASAAMFGLGVFLMAQSAIGPRDVANARNSEATTTLEYKAAIRETTAQKRQTKGPVAAESRVAELEPVSLSDKQAAMPLPSKKEGGPDQWVKVAGTDAIMRSGPAAEAPMIVAFPVGRQLSLQAEKDGWTKVEEPKTKTVGWIKADQLVTPDEMRMARLEDSRSSGAASDLALDESESTYSDDWATQVDDSVRPERRRSGPLGGLLRRAFGR